MLGTADCAKTKLAVSRWRKSGGLNGGMLHAVSHGRKQGYRAQHAVSTSAGMSPKTRNKERGGIRLKVKTKKWIVCKSVSECLIPGCKIFAIFSSHLLLPSEFGKFLFVRRSSPCCLIYNTISLSLSVMECSLSISFIKDSPSICTTSHIV